MLENRKEINKEKTRLTSKAKIEAKRILQHAERTIFEELMAGLLAYGKEYRKTSDYERTWMQDLDELIPFIESDEIELYCNEEDLAAFKAR